MATTSKNPRDAFVDKLPAFARGPTAQRVFSHLTGLQIGDKPMPSRTQVGRVAQGFAMFSAGTIGGVAALTCFGEAAIVALPAASVLAVGGARDLQLTIYHHCAHGNVISKEWSQRLGKLIDKLLLIEPFESYAKKHTVEHHGRHTVSSDADPTVKFVKDVMGIKPGLSVEENGRRFRRALVSPRVHFRMMRDRLRLQFVAGSWTDRLLAGTYLGAVASYAILADAAVPVLLGWAVPLTVGYQIAQCARLVVEHRWPQNPAPDGKRDRKTHDELTVAVRCAVRPPEAWTVSSTAVWVAEMSFNAFIRVTVLPGDSGPSHHWHHGEARGDWANHIRAAAEWERKRIEAGLEPSPEAWGYREALRLTLESFATATSEALVAPTRRVRERELQS